LGRALPGDDDIKVSRFGQLGAYGFTDLVFRQAHEAVHVAGTQSGKIAERAEPTVGHEEVTRIESVPEFLEKLTFVGVSIRGDGFNQRSGEQAKDANELHGRESAARLLVRALGPTGLISRGVRHGETGSIHKFDVAAMPKSEAGDVSLHVVNQMRVNIVDHVQRDLGAGLAVSGSLRRYQRGLLMREFAASVGHGFANSLPAGAARSLHLVEKAPKNNFERVETTAAVVAFARRSKQRLGDEGTKDFAELGERSVFREFGESLREW